MGILRVASRHQLALLPFLVACGSDIKVTEQPRCDGQQQAGEDAVDAPFDRDGDGFFDGANPDCIDTYPIEFLDCDDGDANVNPGAVELVCNDVDDDCDPATADLEDIDGDGFDSCVDCNDNDSLIHPAAPETFCNGIDDDCNVSTPDEADLDGDGFSSCVDCDDTSAQISPGATELTCDGIDNDCDARTEDDPDVDGDGSGVCSDCDDGDADRSPDFDEECGDGVDNDCNGEIDEECSVDYTGVWTTGSPVSYSCAGGAVNINTSTVAIEDYYPAIRVSMGTSQPGTMNGNFTSDTEFFAGRNIAGACTEDYRVEGEFTDENTFAGTLSLTFTDVYGFGLCYDCASLVLGFTATR